MIPNIRRVTIITMATQQAKNSFPEDTCPLVNGRSPHFMWSPPLLRMYFFVNCDKYLSLNLGLNICHSRNCKGLKPYLH